MSGGVEVRQGCREVRWGEMKRRGVRWSGVRRCGVGVGEGRRGDVRR